MSQLLKDKLAARKRINLRRRARKGEHFKGKAKATQEIKAGHLKQSKSLTETHARPLKEFKERHGGLNYSEWFRAVDRGLTLEQVQQAPDKRILSGPTEDSYPPGVHARMKREARRDGLADKREDTLNGQMITYSNPLGGGAGETTDTHLKEVFSLSDRMSGIDLSAIPGMYDQKYGPDIKLKAVITWLLTGNLSGTERALDLSKGVVSRWKRTADWWPILAKAIQKERGDELDIELTNVIHQTQSTLVDRLTDGDWKYNAKLDKLVRVPIQAREASSIMDRAIINRNLLRGDPTSRTESVSIQENLGMLKKEFAAFVQAETIEGELDDKSDS